MTDKPEGWSGKDALDQWRAKNDATAAQRQAEHPEWTAEDHLNADFQVLQDHEAGRHRGAPSEECLECTSKELWGDDYDEDDDEDGPYTGKCSLCEEFTMVSGFEMICEACSMEIAENSSGTDIALVRALDEREYYRQLGRVLETDFLHENVDEV